ncbi:MAG: DUF2156 domain-containing protein [Clostridiales bacterium]|nr:DUF2156 domain-containing protein [Clostridiales bacterium]
MLSFEKINGDNIVKVSDFLKYKISRTNDYSIGSLYMWREFYESSYTIYEGMLIFKVKYLNRITFTIPVGDGSFSKAIEAIKEYCIFNDIPFWFCTVPKEGLEILVDEYKGTIPGTPSRDWADYLYNYDDLANMAGRKYSGQRNHINKFNKLYPNHKYHVITSDNVNLAIDFLQDYKIKYAKDDSLAQEELDNTLEIMPHIDRFKLLGGFITVDDNIVALSVGEAINDTLYCHIEKAVRDYQGSYQMIVREFARHNACEELKFINREEDVGDEGLRKSKLSYHPVELLDKYCVLIPMT